MESSETPTSPSPKIEYRRGLHRDPDKGFDKLSTDHKVLFVSFRTALEEAKQRIVRLRDENDIKDDIIEDERKHRRALEEKLEKYLVDPYISPDVNDELHQRLPKAKKKGLLFRRVEDRQDQFHHLDSEHDAESESSDIGGRGLAVRIQDENSEPSDKTRMQPSMNSHSDHCDNQQKGVNPIDKMTASGAVQQSTQGGQQGVPDSNPIPAQSALPGPFPTGVSSIPGFPQYPYFAPMYPYFQTHPLASASMTSFASSSYAGLPSPTKPGVTGEGNQQNLNPNPEESAASPRNTHHPPASAHHPADISNPHLYTFANHPGTNSVVPPLNLNTTPASFVGPGFVNPQDRQDNVSHLSRLLQEVSVLKRENKELKTELKENKRDLELLKMDAGHDDENKNAEAIAALIEEVKRAEKAGEKAVSQLMQSANEDRNVALHELDHIRVKAAKRNLTLSSLSQSDVSCLDDENEFVDITASSDHEFMDSERNDPRPSSLQIEQLLERQREITKQQMEAVIVQRDDALDKVYRLQNKLSSVKLTEFPGATNQKLQAKLKITEKERDIAVGKLKLLSKDMNEVTLMYNLQKALLTDGVNIDSNNPPSSKWTNNMSSNKNNDNNTTEAVLEKDDKKKYKFEAKLKSLERDNAEKEKRIEKLEELVLRQRKKLNTLCSGPLLMDD